MSKDNTKQPESTGASGEPAATSDGKDSPAKPGTAKAAATGEILDELSRKNTVTGSARRRRRSGNVGLLMFILLLPFLAAAVFLAYQQYLLHMTVVELRRENQQLSEQLSGQSASLTDLQQQVNTPVTMDLTPLRETEASLNAEINALQQQLAQLESRQRVNDTTPDFGWKILEAEFLVRQAGLQLELQADIASAISLLEMADGALVESGQGGVFAARQALSDDLAQLRGFEVLDRDGLYLRLANLADAIADVDLLESMRNSFENRRQEQSSPVRVGQSSSGVVASSLEFLGEIFVWREWEERPQAMLANGQETVIKQNLRLLVKQAQLALLNRDGDLYHQSLNESEALLNRYAVTDSAAGRTLLADLNSLREIEVDSPLPSLQGSLTAVQALAASER